MTEIDYMIKHKDKLISLSLKYTKNKELAEDVYQESIIKLLKNKTKVEKVAGFCGKIIINESLQVYKKESFGKKIVNHQEIDIVTDETAETKLINLQSIKLLNEKIETLPKKQRKTIKLRFINEDESFHVIAKELNVSYDTAKANYRHGIVCLKDSIINSCEIVKPNSYVLMKEKA